MDIGLYSLFGQYDRFLLKNYDLFFLDGTQGGTDLNLAAVYDNFESYMKPILKQNSQKLKLRQGGFSGYRLATDEDGEVFYQQAVTYMKDTLGSQGVQTLVKRYKKCFENADLVIEAIPEIMDLKKNFYEEVSELVPEDTILASNTSAISVNQLSEFVKFPERFCGTHFLNPPHIIPLVEITKGDKTDQAVCETLYTLFKDMGKEPVLLKKDVKGFLSNRLQFALLREATYLVEQGVADPEDIDRTIKYGNGLAYTCPVTSSPWCLVIANCSWAVFAQ